LIFPGAVQKMSNNLPDFTAANNRDFVHIELILS
jgi:hypothetical protein